MSKTERTSGTFMTVAGRLGLLFLYGGRPIKASAIIRPIGVGLLGLLFLAGVIHGAVDRGHYETVAVRALAVRDADLNVAQVEVSVQGHRQWLEIAHDSTPTVGSEFDIYRTQSGNLTTQRPGVPLWLAVATIVLLAFAVLDACLIRRSLGSNP